MWEDFKKWLWMPSQWSAFYSLGDLCKEMLSGVSVKRFFVLLLAVLEVFGLLTIGTPRTPIGPPLDLTGYSIVFEDDFNGDALDMEKWEYRASGARSAGFMHPDQVRVQDGKLILKAEYLENGAYGPGWYSGMVRTVDEFQYGYFEMTCVCSKGGGFWSAWWLNSTGMESAEKSNGGIGGAEIDIFEAFNYNDVIGSDSVSMNVHVGGYGDGLSSQGIGSFKGNKIYTQNNTFGLLWTPTEYIFYVNGIEATRSTFEKGVSQEKEYGIISLELPSEFSEQPGFSTEFLVDSIKIYQK